MLKARDINGAHHANVGETFLLSITSADGNVTSDYNYAVFFKWISVNYAAQSGTAKYWDLNVVDANYKSGPTSDENIVAGRIVGGACLSSHHAGTLGYIDMNIISFNKINARDLNTFDVNITVPTADRNVLDINGKVGVIELWRLTSASHASGIAQYTCTSVDANAAFAMGPALQVKIMGAPPEYPAVAPIDGNVTVFGYGLPIDANIIIRFKDVNGAYTDLNTLDINSGTTNPYADSSANEKLWDQNGLTIMEANNQGTYYGNKDLNRNLAKATLDFSGTKEGMAAGSPNSFIGVIIAADANGDFDVNIRVPFTRALAGPGGVPDNNIRADIRGPFSWMKYSDINILTQQTVIVTPGFTMSTDENVTVGLCLDTNGGYNTCKAATGSQIFSRLSIEEAMRNGYIRDTGSVKGFEVLLKSSGAWIARVKMNSDMNMSQGPRRDYDSSMHGSKARMSIDSSAMPEFGTDPFGNPIDANITLYNIPSTGAIPIIARNGVKCPPTVCKNLDNGAFSYSEVTTATDGTSSWVFNGRDGNLTFRVSGFSAYSAGTLTATVTGDANSGLVYYTRDGNLTITFTYSDSNYQDQNIAAYGSRGKDTNFAVSIYLSKAQCGQHYLLYTDYNMLDMNGIMCTTSGTFVNYDPNSSNYGNSKYDTNYVMNSTDGNISTTQTCSITLDLSKYADTGQPNFTPFKMPTFLGTTVRKNPLVPDIRKALMGQFYVDINMSAPRDHSVGNTVCASGDRNIVINKPKAFITDTNFNNSYGTSFFDFNRVSKSGSGTDANLVIDFNLSLQDSNLSLGDINLSVYYSQAQNDRNNAIFKDLNMFFSDSNRMAGYVFPIKCTRYTQGGPDKNFNHLRDANCRLQWDMWTVREGRYFVDIIIAPSTTDHNRGAGTWKFDINNAGYATKTSHPLKDTNSTVNPAGINDTNAPILSVSGIASTTARCTTVTLDANDTSNIKNYWISASSDGVYDNIGISTTKQLCAEPPSTLTYYFKATDYMDLNSSVASKTIIFSGGGGSGSGSGTTTGTGSTGGTGGGSSGITPTTETVFEKSTTETLGSVEIMDLLTEAGYGAEEITGILKISETAQVSQDVKVERSTHVQGAATYSTTVTITLTNDTAKDWKDVKIIVQVPKAVAQDASEITSKYIMKILKADPIVEFTVPSINAGETASVLYSVAKQISDATASTIKNPIITGYTKVTPPKPKPTPAPTPSPAPAPTPGPAPAPAPVPAPMAIDMTLIGLLIVVIIVVAAVAVLAKGKKSRKGKLGL